MGSHCLVGDLRSRQLQGYWVRIVELAAGSLVLLVREECECPQCSYP